MSSPEAQKFQALVEHNNEYLGWTEHFKGIYALLVYADLEHGYDIMMAARKALFLPPQSDDQSATYYTWSNPFFKPLPASFQIPGLEGLKKEAASRARAERKVKRE